MGAPEVRSEWRREEVNLFSSLSVTQKKGRKKALKYYTINSKRSLI